MTAVATCLYSTFFFLQDRFESHFEGRKDRGATAVEYGLLVGLIAVVIIVAVTALGGQLKDLFNNVSNTIPDGTGTGAVPTT